MPRLCHFWKVNAFRSFRSQDVIMPRNLDLTGPTRAFVAVADAGRA